MAVAISRAASNQGRRVSPARDQLHSLRTPLNEGEWRVFNFLDECLEPDWQIYVQPALNGLCPDFVLLHPMLGIAVVEVKDWDLEAVHYRVKAAGSRRTILGSRPGEPEFVKAGKEDPFRRALQYRDEVGNLYCPTLADRQGIAAVSTCVVFPRVSQSRLEEVFGEYHRKLAGDPRVLPYWRLVGRDLLDDRAIAEVLPVSARLSSALMSKEVAKELEHWLVEPEFSAEQRAAPRPTDKQRELIEAGDPRQQRVRGPAGSGKSVVVAGRAARLADEGKRTLVLTFNITLLNYLRDITSAFGANPNDVDWLNFHWWCKRTMCALGRQDEYRELWASQPPGDHQRVLDVELAEAVSRAIDESPPDALPRYDALLIDEGQDWLPEWFDAAARVLKEDGEILLVADRLQDIYDRGLAWTEGRMRGAGFTGRWNELKENHRMPASVARLARELAVNHLEHELALLPETPSQLALDTDVCIIEWRNVHQTKVAAGVVEAINDMVRASRENMRARPLAYADICVVCDKTEVGREVIAALTALGVNTLHTLHEDERTQRLQKLYFFKGSERLKVTTVESFKGWESRAVLLALANDRSSAMRLLYSGITRVKRHDHASFLTVVSSIPAVSAFGMVSRT